MSRVLFGTDGVRGVANQTLTPELAFQLGQAAGRYVIESGLNPKAVLGRDTRQSGPMLGAALAAGLCAVGVDVVSLGVAPTPAVSYVVRTGEFALGGVISASHNPAPDNGIKFFSGDGCKLSEEAEERVEALMNEPLTNRPTGGGVGNLVTDSSPLDRYAEFLVDSARSDLNGVRIAVDAANGAAYKLAPTVLRLLGADVVGVGLDPNGVNINAEGGATKPHVIQRFTVESGADLGVAFDGDADRAVFSDEKGRLINGDRMMGIWAAHHQRENALEPPVVIGTVMSNMGFERHLQCLGLGLERAKVGDKYVSERIFATGALIGGEQSGHIIIRKHGPTGDGLMTALEMIRVLRAQGRPASSFYDDYEPWPQMLINVHVERKDGWDTHPEVAKVVEAAKTAVEGRGRIVVRASGTQPMIRVMVEVDDHELCSRLANEISQALTSNLGGRAHDPVDLRYALGD